MFVPPRLSQLPNTHSLEESENFKSPAAVTRSCVFSYEVPDVFARLETKFGARGGAVD